ncbi:BTAD domain-containing putative transcriptional regulator [Micromonospora sp. NPDC093277]|uniref:AfsR/SARP family transcriptional regulator n=1 Tax=Micromonospora sp. NPDC093277 TaxID=3364291 RepID=UPI0037FC7CF1
MWRAGEQLDLGTPKARMLLAVLLCQAGNPVSEEQLALALWGNTPPKSATKNMQTYAHRLRRHLGDPARVVREGSGYLVPALREELDATKFEHLAAAGRAVAANGELEEASRRLREALSLWRGPAFAGMTDVLVLAAEAARLDEVRLSALQSRIAVDLRLGRHAELLAELTVLTNEYPLREGLRAQLMLALYRCGRRADALAEYTRARRALIEETGLDPAEELRNLHQRMLTQDPSLDLAPSATARITGFPGGPRPSVVPRMLPPALGDFAGRSREVAGIEETLGEERAAEDPTAAVVVSGRGGSGKTSLAVQVAHRLRLAFPGGQLFAKLGGGRPQPLTPYAVLGRFLRALGVPPTAVPDDDDERAELYRSLLAARRVLVVLDDARDEGQVAPLLPASGTCGVIVTSRFRLGGLAGAHRVELGELSDADSEALLRTMAGDRLTASARRDVQTLIRLCAGLPLALQVTGSLLAARPHYRVADMVAQLDDARYRLDGLRYRGLGVRTSFALSYRGRSPQAQRLFRLLGLLDAPDFAAWAAAAVLNATASVVQPLLDELVDVHLLDIAATAEGHVRYRFHELIRIYARELAEAEEQPSLLGADRALRRRSGGCRKRQGSLPRVGVRPVRLRKSAVAQLADRLNQANSDRS